MTNDEARIAVMTYVQAALDSSVYAADPYRVFGPSDGNPGPEDSPDPFLIVDLDLNLKSLQSFCGTKNRNKQGTVSFGLHTRAGTGIKEDSKFEDFCDSIGLATADGIIYEVPVSGGPGTSFRGWDQVRRIVPFKFTFTV